MMQISDAVTISIVTTIPTFVTVVVTQFLALSRQRRIAVQQRAMSAQHTAQLTEIHDAVNGNTAGMIEANRQLTEANRRLSDHFPTLAPAVVAQPVPAPDAPVSGP